MDRIQTRVGHHERWGGGQRAHETAVRRGSCERLLFFGQKNSRSGVRCGRLAVPSADVRPQRPSRGIR